jgi:predicted nucleotidyltransferase
MSPDNAKFKGVDRWVETCQRALQGRIPANVQALYLYGSVLGPLFRPDSDLDIAVLDAAGQRLSRKEQARLMDLLERATGRGVDLRLLRDLTLSHQSEILEHGLRIWAGDAPEADRYRREIADARQRQPRPSDEEWTAVLHRLATAGGAR